ncbi:MAG: flagellar export protein FliJ [Pseudomonadota bacterium]
MMDLDKLDKVALVARSRESSAANALQRQQQELQTSSSRLEQLQTFKNEYEARLQAMSSSGMDARQLADYRRFLAGLNDAIRVQGDEVDRGQERVDASRETFIDRSLHRGNVDELIGRSRVAQALDDARREQRLADDDSLTRHRDD